MFRENILPKMAKIRAIVTSIYTRLYIVEFTQSERMEYSTTHTIYTPVRTLFKVSEPYLPYIIR